MTSSESAPRDPKPNDLDDLLGLDPDPGMSAEARAALESRLTAERQEIVLDRLLGVDVVDAPRHLARDVVAAVRREESKESAAPRRSWLRPVSGYPLAVSGAVLAAAAALVFAILPRADEAPAAPQVATAEPESSSYAATDLDEPSDELLAALPFLESMDLLTEDLEPLEAEVLFVFDAEDQLMFELLDGGLDGASEQPLDVLEGIESGAKKKG